MIIKHSKPSIDSSDVEAVDNVLASGNLSQGVKVKEFEKKLVGYIGVKHGVAVSSGTAALHLALISLDVGVGDEVIIPSYVCASPFIATRYTGATPKIVDINPHDFNINIESVKANLTKKTKAIIVPHMFRTPAEIDELLNIDVPILENCALSLGAEYKKRKVGSFGRAAIYSFYATKMITTGEGGMVITDDDDVYQKLSETRQYDESSLDILRYNYKMTDFQAALGLSQMNKLSNFISRRTEIAKIYDEIYSDLEVSLPETHENRTPVYFRYIILLKNLEDIQYRMKKKGIMCEKPVFEPLHKSIPSLNLINTDYVYDHALSIPIYPSLTEQEIAYIIKTSKTFLSKS